MLKTQECLESVELYPGLSDESVAVDKVELVDAEVSEMTKEV